MLDEIIPLPEDPEELRAFTARLLAEVKAQAILIEKLRHQLAGHRAHRFGASSETAEQLQLALETSEIAAAAMTARLRLPDVGEKGQPKRRPIPEHIPRMEVELSPAADACADCGGKLRRIGEDVTEELEYVPGRFIVNRIVRPRLDTDARWTKKHGKSHYGYKNHVNVDRRYKLVRRYHVSDAALHDSQAVDQLLTRGNTGKGVWADPTYRSEEMEARLRVRGLKSHIHRKGKRGKPLTEQGESSNRTKSTVRARVEHIFGAQANDMGGTLVRTIGLVRAKAKIGMKNLAYNMRRLVQLRQLTPCPA